ncbi:hypothetical protein CAter282_3445 [Collimonas arenae]|uniref:CsbD-like domain-containing protein n=2 Tax=Collimonas arenae TaxID=279058 RepID=A0A127QM66_9BURK|nr:hypothetical protein CAter282_3445 [Collimonas arenae]
MHRCKYGGDGELTGPASIIIQVSQIGAAAIPFLARIVEIFKTVKEQAMNWDIIQGNWKQFKGNVKQQWGKLTDDKLDQIAGKRDQLIGSVQEAYGVSKEDAERQIREFEERNRDHRF